MTATILSCILSAQLFLSAPLSGDPTPAVLTFAPQRQVQAERLWWGLIDPELSAWFSRVPTEESDHTDEPVRWDWSWRGFLAALFNWAPVKEGACDAAHV